MDISCILILIFVCSFKLFAGISLTKYTIHNTKFYKYEFVPLRAVSGTGNVPDVDTCGLICQKRGKCEGFFYQPSTHQCFPFSVYPYYACTWTSRQNAVPGILYIATQPSNRTFWSQRTAIQRGNSYYFGFRVGLTFDLSVAHCNVNNASVVYPETSEENEFLKDLFLTEPFSVGRAVWIGITDLRERRKWEIQDSRQPANNFDWAEGEPNSDSGNEHCAAYADWKYFHWIDTLCSTDDIITLCEKRIEE